MTILVQGLVNQKKIALDVEPNELLLDVLRDRLQLLGAKRSCDLQVCGACTVLLDDIPVSSCTTLAIEMDGKHVETIEGFGQTGELSAVQKAFVEQGAVQCGFCTPGFIVTAHWLLREEGEPDREEIIRYLDGNICRCSGYASIVSAVEQARDEINRARSEGGNGAVHG